MSEDRRHAGRPRRKGSALIEMVMVIPLLATIIGLTFFFGWTMTNQQNVRISSRYTAWRRVRTTEDASGAKLNDLFFDDRADNIDIDRARGGGDTNATLSDLVDAQTDPSAQQLADDIIWSRCSRGRSAEVAAAFPSDVGMYQRFSGQIRGYHARDGRQWRRIDPVNSHREVTEVFLSSLDDRLTDLEASTGLATMMRKLYLYDWRAWRRPDE